MKRYNVHWLIALGLFIILVISLKHFPDFIEQYYSNGLFPFLSGIIRPAFNLFPFSAGDLIYVFIVLTFLFFFIKSLRLVISGRFKEACIDLVSMLIMVEVLVLVFYLFWGLNYFRQMATQRLNLKDTCYSTADLYLITSTLIDSANLCRSRIKQSDLQQSDKNIYNNARQAMQLFPYKPAGLKNFNPDIKPSLLSPILNYILIAGHYNPFTTEAQINYQMPVFIKPVVACHEMAHQLGFNPEDEANFAGFLAGISSADKLLKYSAYYLGVEEFMYDLGKRDTVLHHALKAKISAAVLHDFKTNKEYWAKYQGRIGVLTGILYDKYLKANKQPEGLQSYNLMVKLAVAWYRKQGLIKGKCELAK